MAKPAVVVDHVSILFNLNSEKIDNIKEYFIKLITKKLHYTEFWALKDVSFTVEKGERIGILGFNGAGKSTLLKTIAGVLKPTMGNVKVTGTIAPMLELGAGFDPNYSGAENIYLYGATMGYSRKYIEEIDSLIDAIIQRKKRCFRRWIKAISTVFALAVITILVITLLIPFVRLKCADKLFNEGKYDEAMEIYQDIGGFSESEQRITVLNGIEEIDDTEFEKGIETTSKDIALKLLQNNIPLEIIINSTGLSKEDLDKLKSTNNLN